MIKKSTAIFFILLANIILLAYVVFPHHHHESQFCIISTHCQADSKTHKHNTPERDHEHDGNKNTEYCFLKQVVVIPANSVRIVYKSPVCTDHYRPYIDFQSVLFNNELKPFVSIFLTNADIPLTGSSYSRFVSTSLGLRAPPLV